MAIEEDLGTGFLVRLGLGEGVESLLFLEFVFIIVAAVVFGYVEEDDAVGDAEDVPEPEEVEGLEGGEEDGGDVVGHWRLELSSLPVHDVWSHGLELSELGVEDFEVDIMA